MPHDADDGNSGLFFSFFSVLGSLVPELEMSDFLEKYPTFQTFRFFLLERVKTKRRIFGPRFVFSFSKKMRHLSDAATMCAV